MRDSMTQKIRWYLQARYKYVWDVETISDYIEILSNIVYVFLKQRNDYSPETNFLTSPYIGLIPIADKESENRLFGYALYISDARMPWDQRCTLFAQFKAVYKMSVGGAKDLIGLEQEEGTIKHLYPDRVDEVITEAEKIIKLHLAKDFGTLANKSLNHRRAVGQRLRYQVLQRDNFTCQSCGRRAPDVKLHVDHIQPVSWDSDWEATDNLDDYQTLCEDCNLGKGDLSWVSSIS